MTKKKLPTVSFIIPVLNAVGILENCLQSIRRQDYPQDRFEIIVGDAGSTDGTRELAKKFGALVVDDHGRNIEDGKRAALVHATGEFVVFIDADNEITHPDYIRRGVEALAQYPKAFGVESYYLPSPRMTSFCSYLTCLLHISDPVAWMMCIRPVLAAREGEVERWTFPAKSMAYPLGSNGFLFRKCELDAVKAGENYSDTHTTVNLIQHTGKREWLRIPGRGVHHYYVSTLGEFLKKRRRAMCHFLDMQKEHGFSWTERKPRMPGWLACILCATFVVPLVQTLIALARTRDARWLWHPWASLASALGALWGLHTYFFRAKDKTLIHDLQPRQKLGA
ncbi:MAG TPA: glycosyltransferase family 2 protein [Verrucomicrobiae bacterium]|nr:glycosyltransferase family 2 protein [Verrucomicrobiae bacterium]